MLNIEYRHIKTLKTYEKNPRKASKEQIRELKKSLEKNPEYFEARPLLLSNRTGELIILAGNQKFKAAEALGYEYVPTILLEGISEEKEREIVIRDNVHNSSWDLNILAADWDINELVDFGAPTVQKKGMTKEITSAADLVDLVKEIDPACLSYLDKTVDYNFDNAIIYQYDRNILKDIEGHKSEINPKLYKLLMIRYNQGFIFKYDEFAKYYRSEDSTDKEKELLERLHLVYVLPKKSFEKYMNLFVTTVRYIFSKSFIKVKK